jgi:hypothetical protein
MGSGTVSPLGRIGWRVVGLSSVLGAAAISGRLVIYLAFGLIAILALTGTFGSSRCQGAAQVVLAILLGRTLPPGVGSLPSKQVARGGKQGAGRSFSVGRKRWCGNSGGPTHVGK